MRSALVTGGASGIGRAVAEQFTMSGLEVLVLDINVSPEPLKGTAEVIGDVGDEQQVERAVQECLRRFGRLDVLVNCAGWIEPGSSPETVDVDAFDRVIRTNLRGPFLTSRAVVPVMKRQGGGCIVNVSSIAGLNGAPGHPAYSASKAGLLGLTRSLARSLGPSRIRVNAVCPGSVHPTGFARHQLNRELTPSEVAKLTCQVPLRRVCRPVDIARVVEFLCSDAAAHITGATLTVDGGESLGN